MEKDNKKSNSTNPKHTSEELKEMQSWELDKKIQVTKARIIEWYEKNDINFVPNTVVVKADTAAKTVALRFLL